MSAENGVEAQSTEPTVMDVLKEEVEKTEEKQEKGETQKQEKPESPEDQKANPPPKGKEAKTGKDGKKPVRLDFTKKGKPAKSAKPKPQPSPFRKAKSLPKRLKLFLWGDSGAGKTTLALQFPNPVVIDMEGGTELYGDAFNFDVFRTTNADEIIDAVEWLERNKHPYRTLILDPITILWDGLQKKWSDIFLVRNKRSKGYKFEFYDLQVRDWLTIKGEFKWFVRKLAILDMNVIAIARAKTKYAEGEFMKVIGETFDSEKGLPYAFDTIAHMFRDKDGKFMAECPKDRANKLPATGVFEISYKLFERLYGKEVLEREAKVEVKITKEMIKKLKGQLRKLALPPDRVAKRLASYGVEHVDELSKEDGEVIIGKLDVVLRAAGKSGEQEKRVESGKEKTGKKRRVGNDKKRASRKNKEGG